MTTPIVLPDEIIERARQLVEEGERTQWVLGDFLADVYAELSPLYAGAGVRRVRAGILRDIANRVGVDKTTLYDRMGMAEFFDPGVRAEYMPPLGYSQLRACKSAGDRWREYADWAVANLPAPVALLRAKIKANGHDLPGWVVRWERVLAMLGALEDDPGVPEEIRRVVGEWVRQGEGMGYNGTGR